MILHGFAIKIIFIKGIKISECDKNTSLSYDDNNYKFLSL